MARRMSFVLATVVLGLAITTATAWGQGSSSSPASSQPASAASAPARLSREDITKYMEMQRQLAGLISQKKYEEAEGVCRQVIQFAPRQPDGYYNLGCIQARLGKTEEALASIKRAMEAGFADSEHMKVDEDLTALHSDDRWAPLVQAAEENADKGGNFPYDKGQEMPGVKTLEGVVKGGLRYRLRMDPNATKDRPNRIIIWFHPSGGYANNVVEAMTPMFLRHGYALLVFTQKNSAYWTQDDLIRGSKTAKALGKTEGLDSNRVLLMGYSAGGQAALMAWQSKPGALGGLILDAAYPTDAEAYASGRVVVGAPPKDPDVKTTPIFVAVGELDGGSQLWRKAHPAWLAAGVPLTVHYVAGGKHQWLFNKATTAELDQWLADVSAGKLPSNQPTSAPAPASSPAGAPAE